MLADGDDYTATGSLAGAEWYGWLRNDAGVFFTVTYLPRDFVQTACGLTFAVVAEGVEQGRIPCFLRYLITSASIRKLDTHEANDYLKRHHPCLLFRSRMRDIWMHGVPCEQVVRHFRPRERMREIIEQPADATESRVARLIHVLSEAGMPASQIGITGSILVSTHRADSDIDLVLYDPELFEQARQIVAELSEHAVLTPLDETMWKTTYERRGCSLTFEEYLWHERRKHNKAVFENTKFDLGLVVPGQPHEVHAGRWCKRGKCQARAKVVDDRHAFFYPSRLLLDDNRVSEVVCYTPTYTGQARVSEIVEVSGLLEESDDGRQRIVVGTSREAVGQYIRVLRRV